MQKMLSHFLHFFVIQCRTHKGGENYDVEKTNYDKDYVCDELHPEALFLYSKLS